MSKKAVGFILCVFLVAVAFILGAERGKMWAYRHTSVETDTLYLTETILVEKPAKKTEEPARIEYVAVTDFAALDSLRNVADSLGAECSRLAVRNDSLLLALEITTAHYSQDSLYDAWVSGWRPSLDSIKIYQTERIVVQHVTEYKPTRWSAGVTAGVGVCKDGLSPFVGLGVTYSIISF